MSGFKLHAHDVLRDPTKDELYNGPKREKLPAAVQRMDAAETACTFCGVSYFVFAEVQELTQRVQRYESQCQSQEFEAKAAESDARWRDVTHMMECQAASVTEAQVKLHQMQAQVALAQAEAARVAANAQVERADVEALQDDVAKYKHLATALEKNKALLLAERDELKQTIAIAHDKVNEVKRAKLSSHQDKSAASSLEKKLRDVEAALRDTKAAMEQERADWDRKHVAWERKVTERDVKVDAMAKDLQQMRSAAPTVVVKEVVTSTNNNKALEGEVERLTHIVAQKDQEIQLLQQTVHRECMERTSMLEKMRSAKILPDMVTTHGSSPHLVDERGENDHGGNNSGGGGGLASFYEKLRKKKARPKTKA
ncbi:hypothetical protein DYB35_005961 [Aphanomyces astaci]|uniref:Uncharacterized protein n=1 Tax=Aphanomyces astaci TaxID=112090 RepID=A0A3R6XZ94_APHAT|nr:hypothetical protein DYB35_005961 [Aphanomyces astaci]